MHFPPLVQEITSTGAFNFFLDGLRDVVAGKTASRDELLHVSSVLAHYAQTSRYNMFSLPQLADLGELSVHLNSEEALFDFELVQSGGAQCLLFAGFFREQMRYQYDLGVCNRLGCHFYAQASRLAKGPKQNTVFDRMSRSFPEWACACSTLSRNLRENPYLFCS